MNLMPYNSSLTSDLLATVAQRYGTPCYVYDRGHLESQYRAFDEGFGPRPHQIYYSVKANSNLAILNCLARLGAGFDIVSGGELARVIAAGGDPGKVFFSGMGKTEAEMHFALKEGVACFNVESVAELDRLNAAALSLSCVAPISLRINPHIDIPGHPYISTGGQAHKFGIDIDEAIAAYEKAAALPGLKIHGIDCHIGSMLTDLAPLEVAAAELLKLVGALAAKGISISHIDLGGGLGICYQDEAPPSPGEYVKTLCRAVSDQNLTLCIEPGRAIIGPAGVLLTRVEYIKQTAGKHFCIVDAAMNDCLRPALYNAWHTIEPLAPSAQSPQPYDIVGPICESGDFFAKDRLLPPPKAGDLLIIKDAGAYAFSMSSQYNSRPRAAEVLVEGEEIHLIRKRECVTDLFAHEAILP